MAQNNVETRIENLISPIISNLQYELYDVLYVKEGKDFYLRIMIDHENGISLEDCEKVNHAIDEILDEADMIKESYFLEVSSPGIERTLRKPWQFERQIGNEVNIKLFKAIDGKKEWQGILKQYNENELVMNCNENMIEIEIKNIATAKTVCNIF